MNNYNDLVPLRKHIKKIFNITTFEEIVNQGNLMLLERISKEQQEKGQRFMADKEISVFYQLRKWLSERWNKKITTKKEMLKKHLEFNRLNYLLNISRDSLGKCDKDIKNYIKNITNSNPEWLALKDKNSSLRQENERLAYLTFGTPAFDKKTTDDWQINITEKELKKIIRKEIILHEYGHLFEYLKEVIMYGSGKVVGTLRSTPEDVLDSEGKANAYAIDNMYRKDRRNFLKHSEGYNYSELDKSKQRFNDFEQKKPGLKYFDLYKLGTFKHSKKLDKTLQSIQKEITSKGGTDK